MQPFEDVTPSASEHLLKQDITLQDQIVRLHRLTVYGRWSFVLFLWLTVAPLSLWGLRYPISLLREYFTWSAVRYGLAYHPISAIGLSLCIGMTVAVLIWQSRNILLGLPDKDKQRLARQVQRIRQQGRSHPLWQWICHEIDR
jgi:hypothetical protein